MTPATACGHDARRCRRWRPRAASKGRIFFSSDEAEDVLDTTMASSMTMPTIQHESEHGHAVQREVRKNIMANRR